jgi:hypothetical protein
MPDRGLPSPLIVSYPAIGAHPTGQIPLSGPDAAPALAPVELGGDGPSPARPASPPVCFARKTGRQNGGVAALS